MSTALVRSHKWRFPLRAQMRGLLIRHRCGFDLEMAIINGGSLFEHRCLLLWFDLINGGSLFEHRCGVYSSAIDAGSIWKWRLSMAVPSSSTDVYCSGSISSMAVPSSIKPGTYREKIAVPADKPFITLSGTDASTTIITWNDGGDIFNSPTVSSNFQVDVSSAANEEQQTSISQVIYVGVHIVSPLITLEMLKYPKLCYDYFALLSHMLEVYPEMIPKLNHEAFGHISGTLDFGLHHQDEEIVGMCLTSLRAVAIYHHKERGGGREGLGPQATSYKGADGNFQDGILSRFLRSLLQLILFEDYSTDLVGAAADALFPLILCDHGLYQRLGNELVERQGNSILKTRMASALHSLTTSDDLSPSADRSNMRKFRKNLNRFLIDVRGFLRVI